MQLVFRHQHSRLGNVNDLMAFRLGVFPLKGVPAMLTHIRFARDHLVHLVGGHQAPTAAGMALLSAAPPSLSSLLAQALDLWAIAGRRLRGVARILLETLFQLPDLVLQLRNSLRLLDDDGHQLAVRKLLKCLGVHDPQLSLIDVWWQGTK